MYIERHIDIYRYYNDNSNKSNDDGDGGDDDDNNGNRVVALSRRSEIWEQIYLEKPKLSFDVGSITIKANIEL